MLQVNIKTKKGKENRKQKSTDETHPTKLSKQDTEQTTRDDLTPKTLASLSRDNKIYTIVWHSLCNKIDQKRSTYFEFKI